MTRFDYPALGLCFKAINGQSRAARLCCRRDLRKCNNLIPTIWVLRGDSTESGVQFSWCAGIVHFDFKPIGARCCLHIPNLWNSVVQSPLLPMRSGQ